MNVLLSHNDKNEAVLILVLEPGNIELLKQTKPIVQHVESFFPNGIPKKLELVIYYSETPIADGKELSKMAEIKFDERSAANAKRRPHCPECKSTVEQLGLWQNDSPLCLIFCFQCGCIFGSIPKSEIPGKT